MFLKKSYFVFLSQCKRQSEWFKAIKYLICDFAKQSDSAISYGRLQKISRFRKTHVWQTLVSKNPKHFKLNKFFLRWAHWHMPFTKRSWVWLPPKGGHFLFRRLLLQPYLFLRCLNLAILLADCKYTHVAGNIERDQAVVQTYYGLSSDVIWTQKLKSAVHFISCLMI